MWMSRKGGTSMSIIGFIAGMFDPLHAGHVEILKIAKSKCDYLIVAVGTDDYIREHKKHEPLLSYDDRSCVVEAIKYVDRVVATDNHDKKVMYEKYHFDILFAGWDHKSDEEDMEAIAQLEKIGVETFFVERQRNLSSSMIKQRAYELIEEERMQNCISIQSLGLQDAVLKNKPINPEKRKIFDQKNIRVFETNHKRYTLLKQKVFIDKQSKG